MMNFFFSSRRRHTRYWRDWSSDVCSSDLGQRAQRQADRYTAGPWRPGGHHHGPPDAMRQRSAAASALCREAGGEGKKGGWGEGGDVGGGRRILKKKTNIAISVIWITSSFS